MLRKIVIAVLLFAATFGARASEFTDVYYAPADGGGWGVLLIQNGMTQFLAFFVFDQNGNPTWYSCQLKLNDAGTSYTGTLYASTGTYYGLPWNSAVVAHTTADGTCSFTPSDIYNATLTYSVNNGPMVVKALQRLGFDSYAMSGIYSGSAAGQISGCQDPTFNDSAFRGRYGLAVTQNGDTSATLTLTFVDNVHIGIVCTISGTLTHYGRLYQLNGQASCMGAGLNTGLQPVTINSLHPTGQGIEGHWIGSLGGGCNVSLHFAAVQNVNN